MRSLGLDKFHEYLLQNNVSYFFVSSVSVWDVLRAWVLTPHTILELSIYLNAFDHEYVGEMISMTPNYL